MSHLAITVTKIPLMNCDKGARTRECNGTTNDLQMHFHSIQPSQKDTKISEPHVGNQHGAVQTTSPLISPFQSNYTQKIGIKLLVQMKLN